MKFAAAMTLIELLIVIAIVGIVSVPSFFVISSMRNNQALNSSAEKLKNVLTQAHIFAREAKDNKEWGVTQQDATTYRFRSRTSSSDPSPSNQAEYSIENPLVFSGAMFSIWFEKGTGNTTAKTIILRAPNAKTIQVRISATGIVEVGP